MDESELFHSFMEGDRQKGSFGFDYIFPHYFLGIKCNLRLKKR